MPEIIIGLYHESLTEVEDILKRFKELDASFDWHDLRINTGKECICGGDIEGGYDVDGWSYICLDCGKWWENDNDELRLVPE